MGWGVRVPWAYGHHSGSVHICGRARPRCAWILVFSRVRCPGWPGARRRVGHLRRRRYLSRSARCTGTSPVSSAGTPPSRTRRGCQRARSTDDTNRLTLIASLLVRGGARPRDAWPVAVGFSIPCWHGRIRAAHSTCWAPPRRRPSSACRGGAGPADRGRGGPPRTARQCARPDPESPCRQRIAGFRGLRSGRPVRSRTRRTRGFQSAALVAAAVSFGIGTALNEPESEGPAVEGRHLH